MRLKSTPVSIILFIIFIGFLYGSENYLEPKKTGEEKKESSVKQEEVSKFVEIGEGLRVRARKQSQNGMEINRIKGHIRMLTAQATADDDRIAQAMKFYQGLVEEYELESSRINEEALRLIAEMAPFQEREKLNRHETILLGRLYLLVNKAQKMIEVFEYIRSKDKLVSEEYLELVRAYNQFNDTQTGINLLQEALESKIGRAHV